MKKIIVIGSPGAGKSVFSKALSERTGLRLYHLDMIWHKPDKTNYTREEFDRSLAEIMAQEEWIIDGNYSRTLEIRLKACDTVFLLDFPTELCIKSAENRIGTKREDMPWVETEFDEDFREWILNFPKDQLPKIYRLLDKYKETVNVIIFNTREESESYLCANQAVAEKFSSITYFDDTMVTYPGKTPAMSEITEKTSADGKLTYSVSEVGDDWVLTVGTTEDNTTKEATKLSEAVAEYDTVKSFVTKVVFADSVSIIGKGVCNGWTAIKEVVLPAKDITMNGAETFMNCSTITSIHPANIEKIDGVADLSNVIEFTGAWGGGWAFQGVPISTFVIGETVKLNCANLFAGSGSIKKIVFLGASDTSYIMQDINQLRFGISELIVERWNETVNLPY